MGGWWQPALPDPDRAGSYSGANPGLHPEAGIPGRGPMANQRAQVVATDDEVEQFLQEGRTATLATNG